MADIYWIRFVNVGYEDLLVSLDEFGGENLHLQAGLTMIEAYECIWLAGMIDQGDLGLKNDPNRITENAVESEGVDRDLLR